MQRKEIEAQAAQEMVKDWRFWFVFLASTFLFTRLLVFFFQVDSFFIELLIVVVSAWIMDNILRNHYTNVVASEKGITLD